MGVEKNIYFQKKYRMKDGGLVSSVNSFIHGYYGQFLYANKLNNNNFLISASLPYELTDMGKKLLRFDRYQNIAEINYEVDNNYVKFSGLTRNRVMAIIEQEKNNKILKSEKLLFKISQNKFMKIPEVFVFYRPIIEIITKLHDSGSMKIMYKKSNMKLIKYGKFLQDLNIITIKEDNGSLEFNIGEEYKLIERNTKNAIEDIFNYVLGNGYEYLYKDIGIYSLSPYIKISNSLYYNIIHLKRNVEICREELNQFYNNLYNKKMQDYKFNVYIDTLSNFNIIKREDDMISGDENITKKLVEQVE